MEHRDIIMTQNVLWGQRILSENRAMYWRSLLSAPGHVFLAIQRDARTSYSILCRCEPSGPPNITAPAPLCELLPLPRICFLSHTHTYTQSRSQLRRHFWCSSCVNKAHPWISGAHHPSQFRAALRFYPLPSFFRYSLLFIISFPKQLLVLGCQWNPQNIMLVYI